MSELKDRLKRQIKRRDKEIRISGIAAKRTVNSISRTRLLIRNEIKDLDREIEAMYDGLTAHQSNDFGCEECNGNDCVWCDIVRNEIKELHKLKNELME